MNLFESERLVYRKFTLSDKDSLYQLNLNPEVIKYTGDNAFNSIVEAENFIKNYDHYSKYDFGRWAVLLKDSKEFIGWCGLKYSVEKNEVDIGFRFFENQWNKGFATEAALRCIEIGFQQYKLTKIVGRAMKRNYASVKVLEKIGLKFEKEFDFDGNEGVIYSISQVLD